MLSSYTAILIAPVPLKDLLLVAATVMVAALVLFALAVEAGNYPKISAGIRRTRDYLRHRRWQDKGIATARRVVGH